MTRDEILAMEAGREMDTLIAKKVMGWTLGEPKQIRGHMMLGMVTVREWEGSKTWLDKPGGKSMTHIESGWHPSTDIAAAWEVVEKMTQFSMTIENAPKGILCRFFHAGPNTNNDCVGFADTAPLAICRAALLAKLTKAEG